MLWGKSVSGMRVRGGGFEGRVS
ncbi:hypothetical protein Q652_00587, partial [Bartonella henselae JK 41]